MKFALIGKDTSKSPSDMLHRMLFEINGVSAKYEKVNLPYVNKDTFEALCREYNGFNVTMPYKEEIIPFLGEVRTGIGAVNTVSGKTGYNTDVDGAKKAIYGYYPHFGGKVLILGFGGVSKAFLSVALDCEVTVAVRDVERAECDYVRLCKVAPDFIDKGIKKPHFVTYAEIADKCSKKIASCNNGNSPQCKKDSAFNSYGYAFELSRAESFTSSKNFDCPDTFDYIINATSVGYKEDIQLVDDEVIKSAKGVYDVVYGATESILCRQCQRCGTEYHDGLSMLVYQAAFAESIWLRKPLPNDNELTAVEKELIRYVLR